MVDKFVENNSGSSSSSNSSSNSSSKNNIMKTSINTISNSTLSHSLQSFLTPLHLPKTMTKKDIKRKLNVFMADFLVDDLYWNEIEIMNNESKNEGYNADEVEEDNE